MTLPSDHPFKSRAPLLTDPTAPASVTTLTFDNFTQLTFSGGFVGGSGSGAFAGNDGSSICQAYFNFPYTGQYTLTVPSYCASSLLAGNCVQIFIDQIPCATVGAAAGNDFVHVITNLGPPTVNYVFTAFVLNGQHSILWRSGYMEPLSKSRVVSTPGIIIAFNGNPYPAEPRGSRDPFLYPMSSNSQWNQAITNGAIWSAAGDADTARLIAAHGVINGADFGIFSSTFYQGQVTDPDSVWTCADNSVTPDGTAPGPYHALKAPTGMTVGPPTDSSGDLGIVLNDATNKRYLYGGFGNIVGKGSMLNPADHAAAVTLTNVYPQGFITASTTSTVGAGGGSISRTYHSAAAGKIYCEATITVSAGTNTVALGVANAAQTLTTYLGGTANGIGYFAGAGQVALNNFTVATLAAFTTGDTVDIAADLTAHKIWFRVNGGGWNNDVIGNQNPAIGLGGIDISLITGPYFFVCDTNTNTAKVTFNFGLLPGAGSNFAFGNFTRTPPAGFGAIPANNVVAGRGKRHDMYHGMNWGLAQDETYTTGIIRQQDVTDGVIAHQLLCGLATQMVKAGTSVINGIGWPTCETDFNGPFGLYTGPILYGAKIGIPASTTKPGGLTAGGSALWDCFVNYGAIHSITGGQPSENLTLFAEEAISHSNSFFTGMQADFTPHIMPALRIMRNHTAATPNGGGTPLVAARAGLLRDLPMIGPGVAANPASADTVVRVTDTGDTRVTDTGDTRIVTP